MGLSHSPKIVTNGLVLCLDAANPRSYPGSGTTWSDLSGNGNNGTLVNTLLHESGNASNFSFDGSNDYVDLGSPNSLNITGDITICSYIYPITADNHSIITWANSYTTFCFHHNISTSYIRFNGDNAGNFESNDGVTLNAWNYIVATVSGTTLKIYKNDALISTHTMTTATRNSSNGFLTLSRVGSQQFNGKQSAVLVYNRGLSEAEIKQNYETLRGRYGI